MRQKCTHDRRQDAGRLVGSNLAVRDRPLVLPVHVGPVTNTNHDDLLGRRSKQNAIVSDAQTRVSLPISGERFYISLAGVGQPR